MTPKADQPTIKRPKVILFDWDGTLADTYDMLEKAHDKTLADLNLPAREKGWYKDYSGVDRSRIFSAIYGRNDQHVDSLYIQNLTALSSSALKPFPQAEDALKAIRRQGDIKIAIVTNKRRELTEPEITDFGWDHYFDAVITVSDVKQAKPSAEPIHLALQLLEYDGDMDDVWMVGDTDNDQGAAKEAGCHFIAYTSMGTDSIDDKIYKPLYNISTYSDFLKLLS